MSSTAKQRTNKNKHLHDCSLIKPAPPPLGLGLRDSVAADRPDAFVLRKKRTLEESPDKHTTSSCSNNLNVSSYNSAFLMGLFEDIKHVVQVGESKDGEKEALKVTEEAEKETGEGAPKDTEQPVSPSSKRRRVSNARSLNHWFPSEGRLSSTGSLVVPEDSSLKFASKTTRTKSYMELPAAVSQELGAHRTSSFAVFPSQGSRGNGNEDEGDFGWYIDMEKDEEDETSDNYQPVDPYASKTSQLAFSAPTAPKQTRSHDAELEYALAADTVDDVLGDFF
jgi:hypothetical protein